MPGREDPIGCLEVSELVERLTQQQSCHCVQLRIWNSLDQAPHEPEIMGVARQVRAVDKDGGVGHAAGVQAPDRSSQRSGSRDRAHRFEPLGLREEDRPDPQPGHGGPDNLPVQGMGQAHLAGVDCNEAGPFQVVDDVSGVCSEVVALERFTEREHLDNGAGLGREIADPVLHQIEQPACARQPVIQVPHAGPVDKRAGLDGAKHEFTHVERIAPGDPPELLSGACLHGTAEGQVKERVETGGAEIGEVDPRERAVPNQVS